MQIVSTETSLVIAGAWNIAILTPGWVLKYGLQQKGDEHVQVFFPAGSGALFGFPRYQLKDFSFVVRPDASLMLGEKRPSYQPFLPASLMHFCSGKPMHFSSGVDSSRFKQSLAGW